MQEEALMYKGTLKGPLMGTFIYGCTLKGTLMGTHVWVDYDGDSHVNGGSKGYSDVRGTLMGTSMYG